MNSPIKNTDELDHDLLLLLFFYLTDGLKSFDQERNW